MEIAHRTSLAMERDRKAMRFITNALKQEQGRIVFGEGHRIVAIARVEQFFFLRDPDRHEIRKAERFERRVRSRYLSLAAVDQNQIRKRPALFEQLSIAALHDFMHRGKIIGTRGSGLGTRDSGLQAANAELAIVGA